MKRDIFVGVVSTLITLALLSFFGYLASAVPKWFVESFVIPNMPPSTTVSTSLHEVPVSTLGNIHPDLVLCAKAGRDGMKIQCVAAMHRWCIRNGYGRAGFGQEFNDKKNTIAVACIK